MLQHKILTRTILILSIVNFALAAPVRERPDVHLGASATSTSWKRMDDEDMPDSPGHAPPPSPDMWSQNTQIAQEVAEQHGHTDSPTPSLGNPESLTASDHFLPMPSEPGHVPPHSPDLWSQIVQEAEKQLGHTGSPPPSLDNPGSSTVSDYLPPRPGSLSGSRLPVGSMSGPLSSHPPPSPGSLSRPVGPTWESMLKADLLSSRPPPPGPLPGPRLPVGSTWESMQRSSSLSFRPPPPGSLPGPRLSVGSTSKSIQKSSLISFEKYYPPELVPGPRWQSMQKSGVLSFKQPPPGPILSFEQPPPGSIPGPRLPVGSTSKSMRKSGFLSFEQPPPGPPLPVGSTSQKSGFLSFQQPPPGSLPGPRLPVGSTSESMQKADFLSFHPSPLPHTGQLRPSENRFPSPPGGLVDLDTSSSSGGQTPPPQSPARNPVTRPQIPPSPLSEFYEALSKEGSFPWLRPGPSQDRFPSRPGGSVNLDTSSSTGGQTPPSQSPARDPVTRPPSSSEPWPDEVRDATPLLHPGPSENRFPNMPGSSVNPDMLSPAGNQPPPPGPPGWSENPGTSSSTGAQPPPPPPPPQRHPGPSEGRFPSSPGGLVGLDTSSSTGGQTPPSQSPARDPVTRPPPSPEPLPGEFWNVLLKGSGSPLLHPRPSEDHFPSPPGGLVNLDTSSSTGGQTPPPQSPARDPVTRLPPSPEPLPDQFWNALLKDSNSPQRHPGPSEGRFPSSPGGSVNPNTLSSTGGPPPPQSPEHNPVTHPPPSSEQPLADEFWDALLKGKIKRRISGPLP